MGYIYYTTLFTLYKSQKRNGIARRKWTKINVHFSKGSWDFVQMGSLKTRCQHNAVNSSFLMKNITAYFLVFYFEMS